MIFLSRDARALLSVWMSSPSLTMDEWTHGFLAERLAMKFDPRAVIALVDPLLSNAGELLTRPATRHDAVDFDLRPYEDTYRYICTEYVTHDYARVDALKLAVLARDYPFEIVRRMADRVRRENDAFTIPYLAAALQNDGSKEIDRMRRDNAIDALVASSAAPELPTLRGPGRFATALENARTNAEIERLHRGSR